MPTTMINQRLIDVTILECPGCGGDLDIKGNVIVCTQCQQEFEQFDGIQQLFWPNEWSSNRTDVTNQVKAFYEGNPFPNYDACDSVGSLAAKAEKGLFARMLDEQIPSGARIIECGCGTGQLSNFLSIRNRKVIGADMCLNSLQLGQQFAREQHLENVRFIQMNLFRPPFKSGSFHLVISNGVLHHTSDPRGGFEVISRLVTPGGYILIGLYHHWGRMITDTRQFIFKTTGDRFKSLDPNLIDATTSDVKKKTWFNDQYKHPHESKHTIRETLHWLENAGLDFVRSIPTTHLFKNLSADKKLFTPEPIAGNIEAMTKEVLEIFKGRREGGFFTMIGRKRN
jgi:2-polyprenyl-3-methyl-5-hydroxy-6-metoxy-1,4-benzoquinol methylase